MKIITEPEIDYDQQILQASEKLITFCRRRLATDNDILLIKKALDVAQHAHRNDVRKSGEPYILHPIAVAQILAEEVGLDTTTIISGLLHDVVEDNPEEYSLDLIETLFNPKVREIVDGVTKITQVSEQEDTTQLATIKKLLLNTKAEPRTIFVKIADRLHNLRTLGSMPENKKMIKAAETYHFYAPLAHSFGLTTIRKEMEDLSFMHYNNLEYEKLKSFIEVKETKRQQIFDDFAQSLNQIFTKNGIKHRFVPEKKSLYKTWRIMQKKGIAFHEVFNYLTVRIVFENSQVLSERSLAFLILSHVTSRYEMQDDSFRDFIKNPKDNGFSALLFNVMGDRGKWVEIQVMSERMHCIAEHGFNTQAVNAEGDENSPQALWLKTVGKKLNDSENDSFNFLENFEDSFVRAKINVYTPKGEIIRLPKNATVLDFAFHVHTALGLKCNGAYVNGKIQGADYELKNADQVRVLDSTTVQPSEEWISYVRSAKGKDGIRAYLNKQRRKHVNQGRIIFEQLVSEFGQKPDDKLMTELKKILYCDHDDDIFCKLSSGILTKPDVHNAIKQTMPSFKFLNISIVKLFSGTAGKELKPVNENGFSPKHSYVIDEKINNNYQIAKCCTPIPGDNCIAYKSEQETIFIHDSACVNAIQYLASKKNNVTTVEWGNHKYKTFPARIVIRGTDRKGIMSDITNVISATLSINMKNLFFKTDAGVFLGVIDLYVTGKDVMLNMMNKILKIKDIRSAVRVPSVGDIIHVKHHK